MRKYSVILCLFFYSSIVIAQDLFVKYPIVRENQFNYEEGYFANKVLRVDDTTTCIYTYFDGTMVSLPLYRNLFHNKYLIMSEDFDSIGYYIVGYDDKNQGFVEKKQYNDIAICVWRIPLTHLDTIAQLVVNLYNDLSKKKTSKNM